MPSAEHEQMVAMVQASPPASGTVEESRASFSDMMSLFELPDDAVVEELTIEHLNADWVSVPESRDDRVLMYLHGGGYVIGDNVGYREFASRLARTCRCRVLVLNYRLAPENPFPAAVDDATLAYRWLLAQGLTAPQLAIAGDSAGGGLTFATLVALRDAGVDLPAAAVTYSPWVDLEGTGSSCEPDAVDDPMITVDGLREMGLQYAADNLRDPRAAPLHANLSGLPPVQVFVGTREILLDDAVRIVDNARAAGVDAQLNIEEGLIHVWPIFPGMPEGETALLETADFLDGHW